MQTCKNKGLFRLAKNVKAFTHNKMKLAQKSNFSFDGIENIVGKKEKMLVTACRHPSSSRPEMFIYITGCKNFQI